MKRILFYMLFVFAFSLQAQNLVEIPDSNFRKVLKEYCFHNCFVGDKLNIDSAFVQYRGLEAINRNINSIEGIQYFKNVTSLNLRGNNIHDFGKLLEMPLLRYLTCAENGLKIIDSIPSGLVHFECSNNQIQKLPTLPENLKVLSCFKNKLTALPKLPLSLETLVYSYNKIKDLPSLPNSLKKLHVDSNSIEFITSPLPDSLIDFSCDVNYLIKLPLLPEKLEYLSFRYNQVDTLFDNLPKNLKGLSCTDNKLKKLPNPLPYNLQSLDCAGNEYEILPELPQSLMYLNVQSSNIASLPSLPSGLIWLIANYNYNLKCLPILPSQLENLHIAGTKIECVPNLPPKLKPYVNLATNDTVFFNICSSVNNKNNCEPYPVISGIVFNDSNKNGIKENNEFPKRGIKVFVQPSDQYTFTNNDGYYETAVDSLITYTISIEDPKYFTSISQAASPTFIGEHITKDFALQSTKDIKDLSGTLTPLTSFARPGFSLPLVFEVENRGTTTEYGTAYVDFPTDYILDSTSINSVNGNFNFTDLHPGERIKMVVYGRLATTATLGDTLKMKGIVNIYDYGSDSVYSNNISEVQMLIRGSFDPNDKQGPSYVTPQQVQNGDFIEYTIRFQNTGTDTAFTVVIADTLTANTLPESLEMISTSHNCKMTVKGNQVYFELLNILLPDSNTNEVESHGYVRFKVKPKNTLKLGQSILNTASIYFDYNKPVITNTVNTKVDEPLLTGIQTVSISSNGLAYPNPVENGRLFISNAQGLKYKLNSMQGQLMMKGTVEETGLDVSQLNPGIYMLEIGANENRKVEKIVIR